MEWFRELFDETYFKTYAGILPPERTLREVDAVERYLELKPPLDVLDVPCGFGRHAVVLAQRGYRVTGVDLNAVQLDEARRRAAAAGVAAGGTALTWIQRDMRDLDFDGEFDVAINLFTAFGYFDAEAEDERFLRAVARALRPGGRFLMDVVNTIWFLRHYERLQRVWHGSEGAYTLEDQTFDPLTSRLRNDRVLVLDGRLERRHLEVRQYMPVELVAMLGRAGLEVTGVWGGFASEPFGLDTPRLVVAARKAAGGAA